MLNVHKYRIKRQYIELNDGYYGALSGSDVQEGYSLEPVRVEQYPRTTGPQMIIEISMSMDLMVSKRSVWTIAEWLSMCGGLATVLVKGVYVIVNGLKFDSLAQVLVRKLYFVQDKIPLEINQEKVE